MTAARVRQAAVTWRPSVAWAHGLGGVPREALAGAAAIAIVLVLIWARRALPARADRPAARIPRFYERALRALARRGFRPGPGETAREFFERVAAASPPYATPLARITADYERARFGGVLLASGEMAELEPCLAILGRAPAAPPGPADTSGPGRADRSGPEPDA